VEEIAAMLNISPKTVGNHYTQVKRKLDATNVAALTLLAVRAGVIDH
jgi:two-component system invasion response regulator UvrY